MTTSGYYDDGTVSSSGAVITGIGTAWETQEISPGDKFGTDVDGLSVRIQSVDSDTQLTLEAPWPGAALSGDAYWIERLPQNVLLGQWTQDLLTAIGASGNVEALAGLTGAADKVPYFTAAGQMALTAVPAEVRAVLASASLVAPEKFPLMTNNAGDPAHDIDFGAASIWDYTHSSRAAIPSMTKRADANWSYAGTGGKYSGDSFPTNNTIHWYAAWKEGGVDGTYFANRDPDSASALADLQSETGGGDYAYIQRVGSIPVESGSFVEFSHRGKEWLRKTFGTGINTSNPGTSAILTALKVPTGIQVTGIFNISVTDTSPGANTFYRASITSPDQNEQTLSSSIWSLLGAAEGTRLGMSRECRIRTNTSAEIRYKLETSSATVTVRTVNVGWEDDRGRY